jgi:hypoxanthine phosphoribosyltransferase
MQIHDKHFEPFISQDDIQQAVITTAASITDDYRGCDLVCLVVLKGSFIFAADLVRAIELPCRVEFLSAKSYGSSITSSGDVVIELPNLDITGKHVLLIEDIVDTGLTISVLQSALWKFHPASLEVAALISKPAMRKVNLTVKYQGMEIPPFFIVGYGLDYAEFGRNLPDIWALAESSEK